MIFLKMAGICNSALSFDQRAYDSLGGFTEYQNRYHPLDVHKKSSAADFFI